MLLEDDVDVTVWLKLFVVLLGVIYFDNVIF